MLEDLHLELILTGVEQHVTQETFQRFQDIVTKAVALSVGDEAAATYQQDLAKFKSHYRDFYKPAVVRRLCHCGQHLFEVDAPKQEECPKCPRPPPSNPESQGEEHGPRSEVQARVVKPVGTPYSKGSLAWHSWRIRDLLQCLYMDPVTARLMKSHATHQARLDSKIREIYGMDLYQTHCYLSQLHRDMSECFKSLVHVPNTIGIYPRLSWTCTVCGTQC